MTFADRIRAALGLSTEAKVRVHLMIRGRIGEGWYDVDEVVKIPQGSTLADLIRIADRKGLPLGEALANSPHLSETLMLDGERCPVAEHQDQVLADGAEVYLLAPLAGG